MLKRKLIAQMCSVEAVRTKRLRRRLPLERQTFPNSNYFRICMKWIKRERDSAACVSSD